MIQLDDIHREAVSISQQWFYQDCTHFLVELPTRQDQVQVIGATLESLLHPWESALVLTDHKEDYQGRESRISVLAPSESHQGQVSILLIEECRGNLLPVYQHLVTKCLHPYGLLIGYTSNYRSERRVLETLFVDGLAYFTDTLGELERGMKFYAKACQERLTVRVLPKPSRVAFADPTYEQDVVWDELQKETA